MTDWLKTAVFYEIYPQSFYDTNGDGIGDLPGIIKKLDYIKDLGCNALWINPCFASPFNDAGYDVADYYTIAPRYGTNEDMRELLRQAHERGIRVLLDLVPGHTSIEHEWFKASMKSEKNEFSERYIWSGCPWERFEGVSHVIGGINGICERGTAAVNFFSTQPALNYGFANPDPKKHWQLSVDAPGAVATREAMLDVMRFWLSMGCDGFRVDMAHSLIKNDKDSVETIKLWQKFRAVMDKEFPDAVLISEWGEPDKSIPAGFHMDFLLHFGPSHYNDLFREKPFFSGKNQGGLQKFLAYYKDIRNKTGDRGMVCIPSGNHDMSRIAHKLTPHELKLAFLFLLTVPGAPFIYYGDEIGMRYLEDIPLVEGGYERTGSRTPMQWDGTLNAGFSSAPTNKLYNRLDPDKNRPTVKAQAQTQGSVLCTVRELTRLRQKNTALQNAEPIEFLTEGNAGEALVFERGSGKNKLYVAINPSLKAVKVPVLKGKSVLYAVGDGKGEVLQAQSAVVVG
ncbi:MAG: alpha-amylase family glycosyl hydrolase [Oscillospiraceae bacterium]|nr:alpha-amylase family glycosyl hydrolase [Oscillospiraceae bacterium]